jgi:3-hydroxyisobutyrate dehydrogenase-like beta-hydroxyacid dehydrogenase
MFIALIGYGEVGRILAEDLHEAGHTLTAFDTELHGGERTPLERHAKQYGVTLRESHAEAVKGAALVISAVTANQTVAAAEASAAGLSGGFYLDFNSASPGAKIRAAGHVTGAGSRFVEGAVMAPVPPHRIKVPLLLGGPDAALLAPILNGLGFAGKVASDQLGVASATKMCRSVMIKGIEALLIESLTAARYYGVEQAVLLSLEETFPGLDWEEHAAYCFQRVLQHGRRRSEEMREAAESVREAGLEPWGASAAAERQASIADLADQGLFGSRSAPAFAASKDWRVEADRLLGHLNESRTK